MSVVRTAEMAAFQHFRSQGYLRLEGAIATPLVRQLRAWVVERGGQHEKLYGLYESNPELMRQVFDSPLLRSNLELLLGPHVVLVLNRHNASSLTSQGMQSHRLHRDTLQWTRGLVTLVVYLDDATHGNGCTHVVPGSHLAVTVGVPQAQGGGTWLDEHDEYRALSGQALPVPMGAGGVLLFDSLLFHSTGPSDSPARERAALVFGVRSADELTPETGARTVELYGGQLYRGNDAAVRE